MTTKPAVVSAAELAHNRFRRATRRWGILAGALLGIVIIGSAGLLKESNHRNVETLTNRENRNTETLIRRDIVTRLAAIDRLASRWIAAGGTPREIWEVDAAHHLTDMPGFQAIQWVDASDNVQWIVPREDNHSRQIRDTPQSGWDIKANTTTGEYGEPGLSQALESVSGGLSILIYVPVMRDEQYDGLMVGVLRLRPWLDAVLASSDSAEYGTQIFIAGKQVYERGYTDEPMYGKLTSHRKFEVQGLQLSTNVTPTNELVSSIGQQVSTLILMSGLLLSVLFGLFVYQSLNLRLRARELRAATSQHTALMQNLQGMVYRTLDVEYPWPMQFVSEGSKLLCGHEKNDLEQQRVLWGELIHPQDLEQVITVVRNAVESDDAFELEYRIRTGQGSEKWIWERGRCVNNPDTKQRNIEGFISDITERKLTELRLDQERAYSKSIVDAAVEAVITIDTKGGINSFNQAAEGMFNYSFAEVRGKNIRMLMPQPYRDKHNGYLRRYVETGEAHIIGTGRNVSAQRKDGSIFPIHLSISEIEGQSKQMFVGLIRDITSEKAAEAESRLQREQLAHVDRLHLLGQMATGIAHEINQPLTSISLFSQAGKRFLDSGALERLPDIFDKLSKHALRAGTIIERMQTMTRQRKSEKTIANCNSMIKGIRQLAEAEARIHGIEIKLDLAIKLPMVAVDIVQIQQVALNLLRNGMESMRSIHCSNGDTIVLKTRVREDGDVEISVTDSGAGVSEDVTSKLFSPFWTTKDSGMGMGLSICRSIVIAHGGLLDFVNNESGGATFFFNLPAANEGAQNE